MTFRSRRETSVNRLCHQIYLVTLYIGGQTDFTHLLSFIM